MPHKSRNGKGRGSRTEQTGGDPGERRRGGSGDSRVLLSTQYLLCTMYLASCHFAPLSSIQYNPSYYRRSIHKVAILGLSTAHRPPPAHSLQFLHMDTVAHHRIDVGMAGSRLGYKLHLAVVALGPTRDKADRGHTHNCGYAALLSVCLDSLL